MSAKSGVFITITASLCLSKHELIGATTMGSNGNVSLAFLCLITVVCTF